jgi:hypothetical protein
MTPSQYGKRRCACCKAWFVPCPSAIQHQRYCGKECARTARNLRRASHRTRDIHTHRDDERERQKKHRALQRSAPRVPPPKATTTEDAVSPTRSQSSRSTHTKPPPPIHAPILSSALHLLKQAAHHSGSTITVVVHARSETTAVTYGPGHVDRSENAADPIDGGWT